MAHKGLARYWCPTDQDYFYEHESAGPAPKCRRCGGALIKVQRGKAHGVFGRARIH